MFLWLQVITKCLFSHFMVLFFFFFDVGAAESGKSTLVKQMKIIHSHGFTKQELTSFKVRNFCFMFCCFHTLDAHHCKRVIAFNSLTFFLICTILCQFSLYFLCHLGNEASVCVWGLLKV